MVKMSINARIELLIAQLEKELQRDVMAIKNRPISSTGKSKEAEATSNASASVVRNATSDGSQMMRGETVAEFTGLSASYLAKLRVTGFGPPFKKIGRSVLYRKSDVEAWLQDHSRTSTSDTGDTK